MYVKDCNVNEIPDKKWDSSYLKLSHRECEERLRKSSQRAGDFHEIAGQYYKTPRGG